MMSLPGLIGTHIKLWKSRLHALDHLIGPIVVPDGWKSDHLSLRQRRLLYPSVVATANTLSGPPNNPEPSAIFGCVSYKVSNATAIAEEFGATVVRSSAIGEDRAGRYPGENFMLVKVGPLLARMNGRPVQLVFVVLPGADCGWRKIRRDVRVVDQICRLPILWLTRRISKRMVAKVHVHILVDVAIVVSALIGEIALFTNKIVVPSDSCRETP